MVHGLDRGDPALPSPSHGRYQVRFQDGNHQRSAGNTYLSLLGTILNAAVDDDHLARSPLLRKSGAGRAAATRNQPVRRREVWLTRTQLDRLAEAIDARYRALVLMAVLTGMRWGRAGRPAMG
jgi:integrase